MLLNLLYLPVTQNARRGTGHQQKVAARSGYKYSQPLIEAASFRRLSAAFLFLLDIERIVDVSSSGWHIGFL
jgi:hypothetical protein